MIDAPTSEIAMGRKISVLASFSKRVRSTSTAYTSPTAVATVGTSSTHRAVLSRTTWNPSSVRMVR